MSKPHTVEYVKEKIYSVHGETLDTSRITVYKNNVTNLPLFCNIHNLKYEATFSFLIRKTAKSNGCPKCIENARSRDLSKEKFDMLQPIKPVEGKRISAGLVWECLCDCGNTVELSISSLTGHSERFKNCGCVREVKLKRSAEIRSDGAYGSFKKMLARAGSAVNKNKNSYEYAEYYHDVTVCKEWDPNLGGSYEQFYKDMGSRPEGMTLNRINGAKIYSKENCEWSTISNQSFDVKLKKNNKSGRSGVKWREERQVWEASITKDRKVYILYYGPSYEEACKARTDA